MALCALIFFLSMALYLRTHCATFNINDSGETILACHRLTVEHSPGYPLHCLIGRVFCLVDAGQPMFRVTWLSVVCSSLALVFFFLTIRLLLQRLAENKEEASFWASLAAFFGTMMFAFSYQHWFQAGGAKGGIYTLNTLFTVMILYFVFKCRDAAWGEKTPRLCAFIYGMGLAHHWPNQVVMVPAYLWLYVTSQSSYVLNRAWRLLRHPWVWFFLVFLGLSASAVSESLVKGAALTGLSAGLMALLGLWGAKRWLQVLSLFLLGASAYLYLPFRARLEPIVNWWDPDTFRRFWETVIRKGYQGIGDPRSLETLKRNLKRFGEQAVDQFGSFWSFGVYLLAAFGVYWLWKKGRRAEAVGVAALGFNVWVGVMVFNTPAEGYQWTLDNFFTPVFLSISFLSAAGLFGMVQKFSKMPLFAGRKKAAAVVVLLLTIQPFLLNFHRSDQSRYVSAYDYGVNMLRTANRDAVIICNGDIDILPLWYLQYVQGLRPEVISFTMQLIPYNWFRDPFFARYPDIRVPVGMDVRPETVVQNMILVHGSEKSFYFTNIFTAPWMRVKNPSSFPEGFLWRIAATKNLNFPMTQEHHQRLWSGYRLRWLNAPERGYWDEYTDVMKDSYGIAHDFLGYWGLQNNMVEFAEWSFRRASELRQEKLLPRIRFLLAQIYLGRGKPHDAVRELEKILAWSKQDASVYYFLGRAYHALGRLEEARRAYETALLLKPNFPEARRDLQALTGAGSPVPGGGS